MVIIINIIVVLFWFTQDLRDALNYGLYMPPINGRAGKFLEEERFLKEYPLQGPIGFLEVSIAVAFNGCIELPVDIGIASWKVACVCVCVLRI